MERSKVSLAAGSKQSREREREKEEAKHVSKLTVTLAQFTCRKDAIGSRLLLLPEEALVSLSALSTSSQSWRDSSSISS